MALQSPLDARNPSAPASDNVKPKPMKLTGIIILPPSYRRPEDDSPTSSTSDTQPADPSSSLPDLRGVVDADLQNRRLSTSTSSTSLSVRFAPLPQLPPRKRRSTAPLGIASRGVMMRRRRAGTPGYDMNGDPLPPPPPMWTEEEVERHTQRILAERSGQQQQQQSGEPPSLGKMFKGVWRKVNNNKKPPPGGAVSTGAGDEKAGDGPVVVAERVVLAPLPADHANATSPVAEKTEEVGGVWEEEVSDGFPLNVGQTETIVEGRYPWLAVPLEQEDSGSASDNASARERTASSSGSTEEDDSRASVPESES